MSAIVFGAGNVLLKDEGFGVHLIKWMEANFEPHGDVEFYDGGTMGIFVTHKFEEADNIIIVDTLDTDGGPGEIRVYDKEDIMLNRIPVKMSPHQVGIQEVLLMCEVRGKVPENVTLIGIIPETLESGVTLSDTLYNKMKTAENLVRDALEKTGIKLTKRIDEVNVKSAGCF